jgi:hypothetical protein
MQIVHIGDYIRMEFWIDIDRYNIPAGFKEFPGCSFLSAAKIEDTLLREMVTLTNTGPSRDQIGDPGGIIPGSLHGV